jgi:hypothetical protein
MSTAASADRITDNPQDALDERPKTAHPPHVQDENAMNFEQCSCGQCTSGEASHCGADTYNTYHATNCWQPECRQCQEKLPGIDPWDAKKAHEGEEIYTKGPSIMAQTYAEGQNLVVLLPIADVVSVMVSSARAKRDFTKVE